MSGLLTPAKIMAIAAIDRLPRRDNVPDTKQEPIKSVVYERHAAMCPGVVFEPLKSDKQAFNYGIFRTASGNEEQVVALFYGYRVIVKGLRLGTLTDELGFHRVKYVRQVTSAEKALAGVGESKDPIVTDIVIEAIED